MEKKVDVAIIMGSDSDLPIMKDACKFLDDMGVSYETTILSVHRCPEAATEYAKSLKERKVKVIIAGAGGAAERGNGKDRAGIGRGSGSRRFYGRISAVKLRRNGAGGSGTAQEKASLRGNDRHHEGRHGILKSALRQARQRKRVRGKRLLWQLGQFFGRRVRRVAGTRRYGYPRGSRR